MKVRLTGGITILAALTVALAVGLLYLSWNTQGSAWESNLYLAIGSTLLLGVPLAILTHGIETGLDRVSERQDEIATRQEKTASDVTRLTEEVAQTQADLQLTREQLSEAVRNRITANKSKDLELFKAVGEAPSHANVLNSLVRAKGMEIISDQGCRVGFISDCYLRFTPGWESTNPVDHEAQGPDVIEFTLEQMDATPLSRLSWHAEATASEIGASIAETMQASGVYPGDRSFDAGKMFADLSALLTLGHESITRGAIDPIRHIIQFCPPQWAICDDGIYSTQTHYFIAADDLNNQNFIPHMSEKIWVNMESFEEAEMACRALFRTGNLTIKPQGFEEPQS